MTALNDLTGQKFGRLTVLGRAGSDAGGKALWQCACDCGGESIRTGSLLRRARTPSCLACYSETVAEARTKHGANASLGRVREPLYRIWLKMRERCSNPNAREYRWYGGKGVRVCAEWDDYSAFRTWSLANGWRDVKGVTRGDRMSIDRIDPNGHYEPANCRYITCRENRARVGD